MYESFIISIYCVFFRYVNEDACNDVCCKPVVYVWFFSTVFIWCSCAQILTSQTGVSSR